MNPQIKSLLDAGYLTRKQFAETIGKGDGGNLVDFAKHNGVRMINIPFQRRTKHLFFSEDAQRLAVKLQAERDRKATTKTVAAKPVAQQAKDLLDFIEGSTRHPGTPDKMYSALPITTDSMHIIEQLEKLKAGQLRIENQLRRALAILEDVDRMEDDAQ